MAAKETKLDDLVKSARTKLDAVLGRAFAPRQNVPNTNADAPSKQADSPKQDANQKAQLTSKQPVRTGESPEDILDNIRDVVILLNDKIPNASNAAKQAAGGGAPTPDATDHGKPQPHTTMPGGDVRDLLTKVVDCVCGKPSAPCPGPSHGTGSSAAASPSSPAPAGNNWFYLLGHVQNIAKTLTSIDILLTTKLSAVSTPAASTASSAVPSATSSPSATSPAPTFWEALKEKISGGISSFLGRAPPVKAGGTPETGEEKLSRMSGTAKSGFGSVAHAMSGNAGETEGIAGAMEGMGKLASLVPVVGQLTGGALKLTGAFFSGVDTVQRWTEGLHQANMQFAEFSGSMASVQAEQEARDIELNRQKGEARAESARELAEAKSRLSKSMAPLQNNFANIMNKLGTATSTAVSGLLDFLKSDKQKKIEREKEDKELSGSMGEAEWLNKSGWMEKYGLPPDIPPP